jgi:hypothetical protein
MNAMETLLAFLVNLEQHKISYRLEHNREDSIMALIAIPGERCEVEFFADGKIEVEIFGKSSGVRTATVDEVLSRLNK